MKIQSTIRNVDLHTDKSLADLAFRKDVAVAVETDLMSQEDIVSRNTFTLAPNMSVVPFSSKQGDKPPAVRIRDGVMSATSNAINFTDLGLKSYAEAIHESAEAPLDVLLTIICTGKALSTIEQEGVASWGTFIDVAGAGASAFASLGHVFPGLEPYANAAKLVRLLLQSGRGIHEVVLAVRDE